MANGSPDRRKRIMEMVRDAKRVPCADCGVQYPPYVMDFDHVRGVKELRLACGWHYGPARLFAEMEKCEVVCANCHRERTEQRKAVV